MLSISRYVLFAKRCGMLMAVCDQDIATKILFETLDIASPESPPLSPKPTIQEMTHMTDRECARRCYWIIYFLHVLSTACTRNVRRFSAENMLMRLPVDETSFELGIQSQTPGRVETPDRGWLLNTDVFLVFHLEYLDEMAPKTNYVSEFGHLTRMTALFSQTEDAVGQWPLFDFRAFGSGFDTFPIRVDSDC